MWSNHDIINITGIFYCTSHISYPEFVIGAGLGLLLNGRCDDNGSIFTLGQEAGD